MAEIDLGHNSVTPALLSCLSRNTGSYGHISGLQVMAYVLHTGLPSLCLASAAGKKLPIFLLSACLADPGTVGILAKF